ncbi:MAG TPA: hypothetical protein DHV36_17865 [Desulfobacteraceae bacterium]|nr:hypothetical protein [Desulfobacteraceae bacterium]|tara:strand:+ start:140 stop:916 length:777 start_codon:yes stop_codon:yes gene_type:complete
MAAAKSKYTPGSPAVDQAAQVLKCLVQQDKSDVSLTRLCNLVGIHKSKGYAILHSLMTHGIVIKNPVSKAYSLGPALIPMASKAKKNLPILHAAGDLPRILAEETRSSVLIGTIANHHFYVVAKHDGNTAIALTVRENQSLHITHGAHGKAIFAHLPPDEKQSIISAGRLEFYGSHMPWDMKMLEAQLAECRKKGYAADIGEVTRGITAVSAPVFDHNNRVCAAVVLVGTFGEDLADIYGRKTAALARQISQQCGAHE